MAWGEPLDWLTPRIEFSGTMYDPLPSPFDVGDDVEKLPEAVV